MTISERVLRSRERPTESERPLSYTRVILNGTLPGNEKWSIGVAFLWVPFSGMGLSAAMLDSLTNRLVSNIPTASIDIRLRTLLSSGGRITGWRAETREEDESLTAVAERQYPAAIVGTGAPNKTNQDSVVCSLRTTTPGARGRGRIYWPALNATLDAASGKLTTPAPVDIVTGFKSLFMAIQAEVLAEALANGFGDVPELAVRSVTSHQCHGVNQLQVGDVVDTQRRRRDRLVEARSVLAY